MDKQWDTFCALVAQGYGGEFSAAARSAWRVWLDDLDPAQCIAALKSYADTGNPHRPTVSDIRGQIHAAQVAPFPAVWESLVSSGLLTNREREVVGNLERIRDRFGVDIAGWVAHYGMTRLANEPVGGDYGGAILKRLEESYVSITAPGQREQLSRMLEQRLSGRQLVSGPRRVNALTLIPGSEA